MHRLRLFEVLTVGMSIVADYTVGTPPFPVSITVICDRSHGLLEQPKTTFDCTNEHPRAAPTRSGWKITQDGEVLCPECAG